MAKRRKRKTKAKTKTRRKTIRRKVTRRKTTRKKATRKKSVRKKTSRKKAKKTSGKKRRSGLATKTCTVSPALQKIVGSKSLTRPQIVKKMWDYIKRHKCQDVRNRRKICPDKDLAAVIGSKPVDMLKLAGCISKHVK